MSESSGTLVVERPRARFAYSARAFKVHVDGTRVGTLSNGESATYTVAPGRHEVEIRIDLNKAAVPVEIAAGETVRLTTGVEGGLKMFSPKGSVYLRPADGAGGRTAEPPARVISSTAREHDDGVGLPPPDDVTEVPADAIEVRMDDDVERVRVHSESIQRRSGSRSTVTLSRTVEHTIDVRESNETGGDVGLKIAALGGSIRKAISRELGRSFQSSQTISHEVEVKGSAQLHWVDVWRSGVVTTRAGDRVVTVPIRFRERTEIEVDEEPDPNESDPKEGT